LNAPPPELPPPERPASFQTVPINTRVMEFEDEQDQVELSRILAEFAIVVKVSPVPQKIRMVWPGSPPVKLVIVVLDVFCVTQFAFCVMAGVVPVGNVAVAPKTESSRLMS